VKVAIDKVPEGVKLTLNYEPAKKPAVIVVKPQEAEMLIGLIRTAMNATDFHFEYESKGR
jgi:hypothetical protein